MKTEEKDLGFLKIVNTVSLELMDHGYIHEYGSNMSC